MEYEPLTKALQAVDWNATVTHFLTYDDLCEAVMIGNRRLAIWAMQIETVDKGNLALPYIREMQSAGHHVAVLTSLGLYKPAAAAMRTMLEAALYYTYFRTHFSELATVARDGEFFIQKAELLQYHKTHTPRFAEAQGRFDLLAKIDKWYRRVSAIIHGQTPGHWTTHKSVSEMKHDEENLRDVIRTFTESVEIINNLLLCTIGIEKWSAFSHGAKTQLLAGVHGKTKAALGLDVA